MKPQNKNYILTGVAFFLILFLTFSPVLLDTIPMGHDIRFHLHRIAHMAEALSRGEFPVRLLGGWYRDFGYPVSIYYGDLFLYPFAFLYGIGLPLHLCYRLLLLFICFGTVLISLFCFCRIAGNSLYGICASFLYCFSMWELTDLYVRAAIGEALAMMFLPLVAYGFVCFLRNDDRHAVLSLILAFTGLLQSHIISTVLALVILFFFFASALVRYLVRNDHKRLKEALQAFGMTASGTALLNAGFLVPFLDFSLRYDVIAKHGESQGVIAGVNPAQWILLDYDAYGKVPEHLSDRIMPMTVGLALLLIGLLALAAVFLAVAKRISPLPYAARSLPFLFLVILAGTTSLIPMQEFHELLPSLHRLLYGWIQFPFRYNTVLTLFACFMLLQLCSLLRTTGRIRLSYAVCGVALVLSVLEGGMLIRQFPDGRNLQREPTIASVEENDDDLYLFYDLDPSTVLDTQLHLSGASVSGVSRNGFTITLEGLQTLEEDACADLPLWYYHCYVAKTDTGERLKLEEGAHHRIRIVLPPQFSGDVTLKFCEPVYWRIAWVVSVMGVIGLVVFVRRRGE